MGKLLTVEQMAVNEAKRRKAVDEKRKALDRRPLKRVTTCYEAAKAKKARRRKGPATMSTAAPVVDIPSIEHVEVLPETRTTARHGDDSGDENEERKPDADQEGEHEATKTHKGAADGDHKEEEGSGKADFEGGDIEPEGLTGTSQDEPTATADPLFHRGSAKTGFVAQL